MKFILKRKWLFLVLLIVAIGVYNFAASYPTLTDNPKTDKWYRIKTDEMKSAKGGDYRAFFKKGKTNKVLVYFAGGGVSVDEKSAREETYFTKVLPMDKVANYIMNMGGLATSGDKNPFSDWTVIAFPYATGDFHIGNNEFPYTDKNGKKQILHHNGYVNFQAVMREVMAKAGVENPETVLVTGYSAGGWGASLLADDVFTNYFPNAKQKTLFVDGSFLLKDDWKQVAENVWKSPNHINERIKTDNLMMDQLAHLREKWQDKVTILFMSSTRDGDLAQFQNYIKTGKMEVDEANGDVFQQNLKAAIPTFRELGVHLFIYDDISWNNKNNLTKHNIIYLSDVFKTLPSVNQSASQWLLDAISGNPKDYGVELLDKTYPKKEK